MKELLKSEITDIRWWRDDGCDIDPSLVDDLLSLAKRKVFRIGESLMIPICSAYKMGWSSPVNLAIYRRSTWRLITEDRKLP